MSRFLAFCLLIVPLAHGLAVLSDTAPSLTVLKTNREMEEEIYENITTTLKSVFLPPVTPDEDGHIGPVHVKINTYVRDLRIKNIDTNLYEWTTDLTFRQMWNDKRLAYDVTHHPDIKYVVLNTPGGLKSIWKPDTFFSRSVKSDFHFVLAPNVLIWVYPNGDVLYSCRVTVTLHCHETDEVKDDKEDTTTDKPAAHHLVCPMKIASYALSDDKVLYEWDGETPIHFKPEDLYIPHFNLDKVDTETDISKTKIGSFSSLVAKFHFTHK